jgi:hypothetical protein
LVVEADAGGECEQADGDAGEEVARGAGAVAFKVEQVLACPEDGLDSLSGRGEVWAGLWLGRARRSRDGRSQLADGLGELAAGVDLVADDRPRRL